MQPKRIIAGTRERRVETIFAEIYERQSMEGRARLLAFCHLVDLAEPLAVRFDIQPSGDVTLTLEVHGEDR